MTDSTIRLTVESLGNRVGGIAGGGPLGKVFVKGALPGEIVVCRIVSQKKTYAEAELLEVLEASPERSESFCRYYGECGGCSLQHLDYGAQLRWKRAWIERALHRGGITCPVMADVTPSPEILGYRNRVSFDITGGRPGLHRFRGDVMPVDGCPLLNRRGTEVFNLLEAMDLEGYRRVSVRASDSTHDAMLEFLPVAVGSVPGETGCVDVSVAWQENDVWCTRPPGSHLRERINDCLFDVAPGGFFQVNSRAAGLLVHRVVDSCKGAERVLDLYGGHGTFAIPLALQGASVDSVEISEAASVAGRRSAEINRTGSVRFVTSPARSFLMETVRGGSSWDAVVVDPPRTGLETRIARLLRRVRSGKLVYVSCDPFSLARDLRVLVGGGWILHEVHPVDMFPQTDHVETVAILLPGRES